MKKLSAFLISVLSFSAGQSQRQMEDLDRGLAAIRTSEGKVFISWRLSGTEPTELSFNLYRVLNGKTEKLNKEPITKTTGFLDENADTSKHRTYYVKTFIKGKEGEKSKSFNLFSG